MGLRAHDHQAMPLCDQHHKDLHEYKGPFKDWNRWRREEWQVDQAFVHRRLYDSEGADVP